MEGRKWEEMDMDCLENVFGRVGMESLLLDIPLVCKSWYKATLSPTCWQSLVFPGMSPNDSFTCRLMKEYEVDGEDHLPNVTSFIKFVVNRSCQSATSIVLPTYDLTRDALEYVAESVLT